MRFPARPCRLLRVIRSLVAQPRRILVKGGSGSGKSTLARLLADRLGVPYVELDALHHGPNWTPTPQFRSVVEAALDDDRGWVVDGNYDSKLGRAVVDRAELIVWLDFPLRTKLARLARRTALRWVRREVLWSGNRESFRSAFWGGESLFVWTVRTHFRHKRRWPGELEGPPLVRLRSESEVAGWLAELLNGEAQQISNDC
jgi:hypothetical protein